MDITEVNKLIMKLNFEIWDQCDESKEYILFELRSSGINMYILFMDKYIWDEDNDERDYIDSNHEEYEPLEDYIRRETNQFLKDIMNIKF